MSKTLSRGNVVLFTLRVGFNQTTMQPLQLSLLSGTW